MPLKMATNRTAQCRTTATYNIIYIHSETYRFQIQILWYIEPTLVCRMYSATYTYVYILNQELTHNVLQELICLALSETLYIL